ncbi:MAG: HAD family hydrolase [Treponema sp.]
MGSIFSADIGTTSLKAGIITEAGDAIAVCTEALGADGTDFIANEWLSALKNAASKMRAHLNCVDALCISGNGPTLASENGRTLLWNAPLPPECAALKTHSLFIPKIKAFAALYPDDWNKTDCLLSGPEFLIFKLTGERVTILPEARFAEAYWTDEELQAFGIPKEKLAPFVPLGHIAGTLLPEAAALLSLPPETKVVCGGPDFVAAMIGTNTLSAGKICDCAGSSEGINLCTDKPFFEKGFLTLPSVVSGLWNIASLSVKSGSLVAEHKKRFEAFTGQSLSYSDLIERSLDDKNSEGGRILSGIKKNVRESVRHLRAAAQKNGVRSDNEMAVTGGQAKSARWMQEKADGAGIGVRVSALEDAELLGDAAIAQTALGRYGTIQEAASALVKTAQTYTPAAHSGGMKVYRIPARLKTIIFDIDSTLYTNEEYAFEQVDVQIRRFAEQRGLSAGDARTMISEFRRKWSAEHGGAKISLGNALTNFGVSIEESVEMRRTLLRPEDFLARDEKLIAALGALKEKYALICVTNNPVLPAQKTISALGVDALISEIIGLDTCNKSKPAPELFLLAAFRTAAAPEQCLSVGDRYDMDIALPLKLGMGGILVSGVNDVYALPEKIG